MGFRLTKVQAKRLAMDLAREALAAQARGSANPAMDAFDARAGHVSDERTRYYARRLLARSRWIPGCPRDVYREGSRGLEHGADIGWAWIDALAAHYGFTVDRSARKTQPRSSAGPLQPAQAGDPTLSLDVALGGNGTGLIAPRIIPGFIDGRMTWKRNFGGASIGTAPALARAFVASTRQRERSTDDGDSLHSGASTAVALGLREPVLAVQERARTSKPALQVYVDLSSSMGSDRRASAAGTTAFAIAQAAKLAGIARQVIGFDVNPYILADWSEALPIGSHAQGYTALPTALLAGLPHLAKRPERRRIALVLIDGDCGHPADWDRVLAIASASGIELYAIGIQVDPFYPVAKIHEWSVSRYGMRVPWHGALRLDDVSELPHKAAQELIAVLARGAVQS